MSLRDHPPEPSTRRGGRAFRVDEILAELDPDDREALLEWVNDLRYSPERIVAELRSEGHTITANSIASYRYEKLGIGNRRR
jgi:hypothetical protein